MDENRKTEASSPAGQGMERVKAYAGKITESFREMEPARRMWLVGGALLLAACVCALGWYATRTEWKTLYAGLDPEDARQMATELTAAGIPFDVTPDGSGLRVPAPSLDKARLATTAKGGPRSGRMGFELFDQPNWVGSEFDEKVNYQRALEGELEHTINTLSDVESAHVHLVMPHDSLFTDQQRDAKASVVLKLRHRTLSEDEAESIRNLVSSAVDDLHPQNVTLVDASGRQLGRRDSDARMEEHEQELAARLIQTLEPVAGVGNVRASVNVEYDSSTADEVDESYDPNAVVTLSMQRSEQTSGAVPTASGVPGTASNAPNTQLPVYPKAASDTENIKQESGTYGASKKTRHTVQGAGKIRRITAAVLINHRMVVNGKQVSWQARTPVEMGRLTALAQAAIGFDNARGDQVNVEDMAFEEQGEPPVPLGERLLRTASQSEALLKYATILVLSAALLLLVVRPVMQKMKPAVPAAALPAPEMRANEALEPELPIEPVLTAPQKHAQLVFERVTDHMRREPGQSTRLLQSWIHME
ncbi:flagellar basal-body MS-ring/collar protein FliF [Silvibacterium acidisoli]|uniref:flagellar basal-body MS-ring/collar protein FliF n=1 Tax=Acidobacteriaceae bacterium ZG23-2 TaxID=2883246 RepID=UPI00406D0CDF